MPACLTCGVRFRGRGSHCKLHSSYYDSLHRTSSGFDHQHNLNSSPTGLRTEKDGWRSRTTRFADSHDAYASYESPDAMLSYKINKDMLQSNLSSMAPVQSLTRVFSALTDAHAITSMTYSANLRTGTHSLTAKANFDRERCTACQHWFPSHEKLGQHHKDFPVTCEECHVCLRPEEVWWHGENVKHGRCFVRGCGSVFRKEGGWKAAVVKRHVQKWHCWG